MKNEVDFHTLAYFTTNHIPCQAKGEIMSVISKEEVLHMIAPYLEDYRVWEVRVESIGYTDFSDFTDPIAKYKETGKKITIELVNKPATKTLD